MKTNSMLPGSLLLAASVALMAQSAFAQSPPAAPAPAPAAAPPAKFETTKVADGVYTFRYQFHRNVFLVTSDGVIATDPISPDAAAAMMEEIRKVTDKPVKYVIYSHNHYDHTLGGKIFKDAGAKFVSQENCMDEFRKHPNPALVMPDETYKDKRDLTLGDRTVELRYFGRNHGNCMTVIRLPKEKILVAVDIVGYKRTAFRTMPDYWPVEWIASLNEIDKLDFERVIPGHGAPVVPREAVRLTREYLEDLMAAVQTAMKETHDPEKLKQTVKLPKYQDWANYEVALPLNIERVWAHYELGW
jgi:glyoxylase-like metal-dependent hydrolase (beta-lactamase superfamily II)